MRILIYGINFSPELTGIGKYTGEMAQWLAARKHAVKVVTAPPYYPQWKVAPGYRAWKYRRETLGNINIIRCPLWVPASPRGIKRILHLTSFALSSFPVAISRAILWRPQVVMVVEPTFFCALPALLAARLSGAKAWLHVQDFELDAAFDLGILSGGLIRKLVSTWERCLMRRFDRVSTISEKMVQRLVAKGLDESACVLFPNWVDTQAIRPLSHPGAMRATLRIPADRVIALYSGNIGEKQGLELLIKAAEVLSNNEGILFVICGEGVAKKRIQALAQGLSSVRFLPLQPAERLNELLHLADIHLLPQRADAADLVMPSKLTGMLASGRPIVATAHPQTQVAQLVSQGGLVVRPGDASALAEAILSLAKNPPERARLGKQARALAVERFGRENILAAFEGALSGCVNQRAV